MPRHTFNKSNNQTVKNNHEDVNKKSLQWKGKVYQQNQNTESHPEFKKGVDNGTAIQVNMISITY